MANGPPDSDVVEAVFVRDENPEEIGPLYKDILNKASSEQLSRAHKKLASAEEAERSLKKKETQEPEMTGTQTRQAKLDHIAAQGNFARKTPPAQRSDDDKKAIRDFLKALGTPTEAWE